MTPREIRKKVKQFKKEFGLFRCDYSNLATSAEKLGYTVIEFNHILNDENVQMLIDTLKLHDIIARTKGFVYADINYRLLFIHEDLNVQEKNIVLAHEIGHIFLKHVSSVPIIGKDVREEFEANEFAHYLLHKTTNINFFKYLSKRRKTFICAALAVLMLCIGFFVFLHIYKSRQYSASFYITTTGNKYHEKECIFIKDKSDVQKLTKEAFESGDYKPCKICLP